MLNASVGVKRVLGRLRRSSSPQPSSPTTFRIRSFAVVDQMRRRIDPVVVASRLTSSRGRRMLAVPAGGLARRSLIARIGPDRTVAVAAAAILLCASALSLSVGPAGATGGPSGDGPAPRIVVGGGAGDRIDGAGSVEYGDPVLGRATSPRLSTIDSLVSTGGAIARPNSSVTGPFLADGTLLKPVAVNTTVNDGRELLRSYKVKSGDTLTGIASSFRVSMMTVWWANHLASKDALHIGQVLRIPPVNGLIVDVTAKDTLTSIAAHYKVAAAQVLAANELSDPNLVIGQVLVVPGATGKAIAVPKAVARVQVASTNGNRGNSGGTSRPPTTYAGGSLLWPVVGGGNYISQFFHYGHSGLDIAADYGSTVRAAGAGTVIFAGWKNNGGGYQVWIAHGSGLYTTYNHMSGVSVGQGQSVGRGQQVGRIGQSGDATGPHLHFEVWLGMIWDGGTRVNPLGYL